MDWISPHIRACTRENVEFLIWILSNFVTEFYLKFHREGGDLHSEILSVKRWKNKRKCQKMVLFSWKTWKMVKYFISIFINFQVKIADFLSKMAYFQVFSLNFHQKWAIFSYFWAIFSYFHSISPKLHQRGSTGFEVKSSNNYPL